MAPAARRRVSYQATMQTSAAHQTAYNCIIAMITTPAPQGKGDFTQLEMEKLTVATLNKTTVGLKTPWKSVTLYWDYILRHIRNKMDLDLIPLCDYYFSTAWQSGQSRQYDEFHGVTPDVVARRSLSCIPPNTGTIGYVAGSSSVHPVEPILVMTWLQWRKSVGRGHILNEIDCMNRAVANQAITQIEADQIIPRASIAPIRRLLR